METLKSRNKKPFSFGAKLVLFDAQIVLKLTFTIHLTRCTVIELGTSTRCQLEVFFFFCAFKMESLLQHTVGNKLSALVRLTFVKK